MRKGKITRDQKEKGLELGWEVWPLSDRHCRATQVFEERLLCNQMCAFKRPLRLLQSGEEIEGAGVEVVTPVRRGGRGLGQALAREKEK